MSFLFAFLRKIPLSKVWPVVAILAGLSAVIGMGYGLRWWQALGWWFWCGLLFLGVAGVLVVFVWLLPRYRKKRFLVQLHTEPDDRPQETPEDTHTRLQEQMLAAIRTLKRSPELKQKEGMPLYALPWYLLLGASQSGKTTLLQGVANQFSPFARPDASVKGPTQDCDWWFFNTAIVLDPAGSYAFPIQAEHEGTRWYRFLQLLRHYRELQPINGLILTVGADTIALKSQEELRQEATQLRQRYAGKFETEVLTPLDASVTERLQMGSDTIPLILMLIKRLELINQCLSSTGCPASIEPDMQPNYQLMLDPSQQQPPVPEQAATLQSAYEAYLNWSRPSQGSLRREQSIQTEHLRNWFASHQSALQQMLRWANQNHTPVILHEYWQGTAPDGQHATVRVEGAYTPVAWKQSIFPFLQRAGETVPSMAPLLKEFETEYRSQYFAQWQRFLAAFPRGELSWWETLEHRRELALKLLGENSPYRRILDDMLENMKPFLPEPYTATLTKTEPADEAVLQKARLVDGHVIPAWVRVMQRFIGDESRSAYRDALQQLGEQLADDALLEKSFQLAQTGFQEGKPTEKTTHPVLKAWWQIEQFRKQEDVAAASQEVFWPLIERPVLFSWKVILENAGAYIQQNWDENVVASTQGLSPLERLDFLYGSRGKAREFVDQFVKPFLMANQSRLKQVLDEEVPLSPAIVQTLHSQKQLRPYDFDPATSHQVRVSATRNSALDSQINIVEEKTEFRLQCGAQTFQISNRPRASTAVFWSFANCGDVSITVFISCDRSCVERATAVGLSVPEVSSLPLIKRYPGQSGFLDFIQDFRSGSHEFGKNDLGDSADALRKYHIGAIRAFYDVEVPSSLAKLISLMSG